MRRRDSRSWPQRLGRGDKQGLRHDQEASGIHRAPVPHVSFRTSALTFLDGALEGWGVHQLVTWTDQCLIRPRRLMTRQPFPRVVIREPHLGALSFGMPGMNDAPSGYLSHARAPDLVKLARQKVVDALEPMIRPNPDDAFVRAALFDGRVTRDRRWDGQNGWTVMLTEKHALSEQVLALLAADLLEHREDYEQNLVFCATCGRIDFWPDRQSRRGCSEHPEALGLSSLGSASRA